jgi:4-hydroxybenzoate polyprenyltransferase
MARLTTFQETQNTISGIISLTRWKEQLPLATLTILGALIAFSLHDVRLDWRLFFVTAANFLTVTFAFMINDMEDAEDDAKNEHSSKRNPISNGTLDMRTAWWACLAVVVIALSFYALGGVFVIIVGVINLILSFLYSWKPVRLKSSSFGLDIVSHTLMLGGLLPLAGYFAYSTEFHPAILMMVLACVLGSTYGQLYNQIRDFETDKEAGIINVSIRLGKGLTWILAYAALAITLICGWQAFTYLNYPSWLVWVVAGSSLFGFVFVWFFGNNVDASGKPAQDPTGRLQLGVWFALTISVMVWVVWAMGFI